MISIVDYGMGNLRSVQKALDKLGFENELVSTPYALERAPAVVLPGVGAFGDCMDELHRRGLIEPLRNYARAGRPLMGICLGMQVLFESSEEAPGCEGLGLISGAVVRFDGREGGSAAGLKVPHMGWNTVEFEPGAHALTKGLTAGRSYAYFVHSYHADPATPPEQVALWCEYGVRFPAAVQQGATLWGTQFHPEKSQATGMRILQNFASMATTPAAARP